MKYYPVQWATLKDAHRAQELEAQGWDVVVDTNSEGYLTVVGGIAKDPSSIFTIISARNIVSIQKLQALRLVA